MKRGILEFLRTYAAVVLALVTVMVPMAKADPPTLNGSPAQNITSSTGTIAVTGTSFSPVVDLATTIGQAETFTASPTVQGANVNIVGTAGNCAGAVTTLASGICFAGNSTTNTVALMLGPVSGGTSCTASCPNQNSMQLCFYPMKTSGMTISACDSYTAGGTRVLGGSTVTTNGNPIAVGAIRQNSACSGPTPYTGPSGDFACRVTSASSTLTLTFGLAYSAIPVCTATDETTALALKIAPAAASVTVTGQGASDVIDIICIGNAT